MKMADVIAMGLTVEQYNEFFDDPIEDLVQETSVEESTIESPEFAEETPVVEAMTEEPEAEAATEIVPAVVDTAVAAGALEFKNMKAAAVYLSEKLNLKVTNTLDCLYKCLKAKNHKTHKYAVERREDDTVVLTPLA